MIRAPNLDLALIFPIDDEPSARLMAIKAACLYRAGVITDREKQQVLVKADQALARQKAA